MIEIPANFPSKNGNIDENCKKCGDKETMKHLYICDLNEKNSNIKYEEIFGENLEKMRIVYQNFRTNYENKREQKVIIPRDPLCDPLSSVFEYSNGNKVS